MQEVADFSGMDKIAEVQCGVRRLQAIGGARIFTGQEGKRMIKR